MPMDIQLLNRVFKISNALFPEKIAVPRLLTLYKASRDFASPRRNTHRCGRLFRPAERIKASEMDQSFFPTLPR
jgi:hypothetical protein